MNIKRAKRAAQSFAPSSAASTKRAAAAEPALPMAAIGHNGGPPMPPPRDDHWLAFAKLQERGIVPNRTTLRRWQERLAFPVGTLVGLNARRWRESEINAWLAARPTATRPHHAKRFRGRERAREAESKSTDRPAA